MKKFFVSIALSLTVLFSFAPSLTVNAQSTWYDEPPADWYLKVYDQSKSPQSEIFGERYTAAQVEWVIYSIGAFFINTMTFHNTQLTSCVIGAISSSGTTNITTCFNAGTSIVDSIVGDIKKLASNSDYNSQLANYQPPNTLLGEIFADRPVSSITYVKSVINKFRLVSPVKAASTSSGVGFAALSPISGIWKGFRNIAYAIFVIVTIIFAFMIMFRVKLSPQTVITVQSALPKIIIAMILVTFSYAIAGFAVDLVYVVAGLFSALIQGAGLDLNAGSVFNVITGNPAGIVGIPVVGALLGGFVTLILYFVVWWVYLLIAIVWVLLVSILNVSILNILAGLVLFIAFVILAFVILVNIFRVSWLFFKTLAMVYLLIIMAPLMIIAGTVVPSMGFGKWFRQLMANLLVFPAIGILFYFAFFFLTQSFNLGWIAAGGVEHALLGDFIHKFSLLWNADWGWNLQTQSGISFSGWSAPFMGFGPSSGAIAFIILGIMCIVAMPKVGDILKGVIMGERFTFGTGIGEAVGPFAPLVGAIGKQAQAPLVGAGATAAEKRLGAYYTKLQAAGKDQGLLGRSVNTLLKGVHGINNP